MYYLETLGERVAATALSLTILLGLGLSMQAVADSRMYGAPADLTELPIEALLAVEVYSASKFEQKITEAPASVTIISAADIRTYGYRTLADLLNSVRGMNVSYDRNYAYLGVRGSGRTGDFNSRVLLLVDGYRINDPIYDTAPIGNEFPLDADLIDRVEVVRGPGSSIYGSNAVLGVINVITRHGRDLDGAEVSGEIASFDTDKERLSYGRRYDNGAELLMSASRYRSGGRDLYFPEFDTPDDNNGVARNLDGDRYRSFFGKLSYAGLTLAGVYSRRDKKVPTAAYDTAFNDPNMQASDGSAFFDIGYHGRSGANWDLSAHAFRGRYEYDGIYPYAGTPVVLNADSARGDWWGAEMKAVGRFERHTLVLGAEYQRNSRQDEANFDLEPLTLYLDDRRDSTRTGVFIQDEIALGDDLLLNAGLRFDRYSSVGNTLNPRLGLIWHPVETTSYKLLYGTAFRAPNVYELYYLPDTSQKANPDLRPEKIATWEFVIEHELQPNFRLTADVYRNRISNNINQITDPADGLLVFVNSGQVEARGIELEVERLWESGARLRASHAWQTSQERDTGTMLVNSPRHLAKLNFSLPSWGGRLRTGMELQYVSSRRTLAGESLDGRLLANLTLFSERIAPGLELSASVYNLFDERYADPGGQEHVQDHIQQDGRGYRFKLSYRF